MRCHHAVSCAPDERRADARAACAASSCQVSTEKSDEWTTTLRGSRLSRPRSRTPRARDMDPLAAYYRERNTAAVRAAAIFATVSKEALRVIWLALPVQDRARCACVCRAWRSALADPALWACLRPLYSPFWRRLKADHDALPEALRDFNAVLRAAAAKAAGRLEVLDFSDLCECGCRPAHSLLLELVTANSGTLRDLGIWDLDDLDDEQDGLLTLLHAAPHLQTFHIPSGAYSTDVAFTLRMLRNEDAYRPLRLGALLLSVTAQMVVDVLALASAVAAHTSLWKLKLHGLTTHDAAALDALVDAALTRKIREFILEECTVPSAFASSLARLFREGHVESLRLSYMTIEEAAAPFFDSAAVAVLVPALLSNKRLKHLTLSGNRIWANATAATALLSALASHPSLERLSISYDESHTAAAEAGGSCGVCSACCCQFGRFYPPHRQQTGRCLFEASVRCSASKHEPPEP